MPLRAHHLVVPMGQSDGLYPGMAALYNDQPGTVVSVRRVEVLAAGGQTVLGVGRMEVRRFFATFPLDLSEALVVPAVKLDTNSPDPGLYCWLNPLFDAPAVETITRSADFPAGSATTALAPMSTRQSLGGCGRTEMRNSALLACRGAADVEPVRLTFGGHALCLVQTQSGHPHAGRVEVLVRNTSTGATYLYTARVNTGVADPFKPLFALWSPSGEWDIKRVDWVVDSQALPLAGLRLMKMESSRLTDTGGAAPQITPAPHDTRFPCPAQVYGTAGVLRGVPFGRSAGVPYDYDTTHGAAGWTVVSQLQAGRVRRLVRPTPGIEAGSAISPMQIGSHVIYDGSRAPILLREREALVLCDGLGLNALPSTYAAGDVVFEFAVSDEGSSSPGISYVS